MKGIELPQGDLTFDLELNLETVKADGQGGSFNENINDSYMPVLLDYKMNNDNTWYMYWFQMYWFQ